MNALTPERIEQAVHAHLKYTLGKAWEDATVEDVFTSLARTVRDLAMDVMLETERRYELDGVKMVYYLSMEFLIGRSLGNNLINLGVDDLCRDALTRMGYDLDEVREVEADAALGNGGLGRLAACFLDSMATMGIPGYGYGINYEYGLFKQAIEHGYQVEQPDQWLARGTPWEIERTDEKVPVPLKGRVANEFDHQNEFDPKWLETQTLVGMPYDMPVVGYGGQTVNRLRLYAARASDEFDIRIFNEGHYTQAVRQKISSENVSKILYPRDSSQAGQELRLTQEYFLVACAMRDIARRYKTRHATMGTFAESVAIQLNDTHPALAVAELMRILVDEEDIDWDPAWAITVATFGYTNHTLMPEALERWSASLLELLVPRHLQIIYEINRRFLEQAAKTLGGDPAALERLSIVEEGSERKIRMSNLAVVGSHSVNGVAAIHSRLMRETVFRDFARLWPERFNNKTNGITPRRWLLKANPALARAISERIGDGWITDLDQLVALRSSADDPAFQSEVLAIKRANKHRLAGIVRDLTRVQVDPDAIFDIQAKRLHEYKRQLLNALHIIHLYLDLLDNPGKVITPRAFLFGGKAAPGYFMAKLILKCITAIADVVNRDPRIRGLLRVAFLPDYRVSLAEKIIPAADVSEQISTAGKEASGTGNMKFALNGAVTVGTLDGANVEIREEVGAENIYIFGLTVEEIERMRQEGAYHPWELYQRDPRVRRVIDALQSDLFTQGAPGLFQPLIDSLLQHGDEYFLLADLGAYIAVQERVARDFTDRPAWARKAIHNIAGMGKFSSDRTIAEYAREIWDVQPAGFAAPALS